MSTFKATDKKKKKENDVFKATSRKTFDSAYIGKIENQANDSLNILNDYIKKRDIGGYISSKDMDIYEKAFKNYSSSMSTLNGFYKSFGMEHNEEETNNWISSLSKDITNSKTTFSKFKDEHEFNDAVKIGELNDMPSAEILPHIDTPEIKDKRNVLVSRQKELEKQLRELGASGNKGVGAKKKSTLTQELNDVKKQIGDLEKSKIAYTTSSGQNITWSSLYDKKKAEEDFNTLYGELSASEDWKEKSQYLSTNKKGTARSNALLNPSVDWDYEDINKYSPYVTGGGFSADRGYAEQTTDKEKAIFNYLYHTKGKEAAMKWHKSREDIYRNRAETKGIENAVKFAEDYPVLSDAIGVGASIVSGGEYIGDILKGDIGDTNQTAAVSSAIKGTRMEQIDWEVGEWDVFDFLYGTGTSLVESATSMAMFGTGGGVALGLSAAAQSTNDALNRGMSKGQAFTSGVASGIFEGIFESWSIGAFGDLTKNLKRAKFRDLAKYIGKNMWNNAKEETLTEIANIAYDTLTNGDFSQYETAIRQYMNTGMSEADAKVKVAMELGGQVVEAAGSGALMGFAFGVGGAAKARNNITQMGREIKDSGETRNLVDLGKSLGEGTEAYEYANKITDKSKAFAIGQLLGIASEDIQSANIGDIVKSLERKGYSTDVANNLAEMMLDPDNTMFENSRGISAPSKTYNDIINNPNSTVGQRNEAYQGILRSVAENRRKKEASQKNKTDSKPTNTAQSILPLSPNYVEARTRQLVASGIPIEQAEQVAQGEFANNQSKMSTQTEKAVESKFESNPEGRDINIANEKIITSKKLVASDRDNMAFEVTYDDGTTENVDANNISFGNEGEALVYSSVMDMNVPVGIAESLIKGYNGNDINSAGTYVNGMREAFTFGKHNQEADLKNGAYSSQLTEEQRSNAFRLGKIYANEKAIADEKAIQGETKPTDIKKQDGKVHFEGDKLSLKSVQDVSLESLDVLTKAINKDIHIFESYVDKNGKRVYKNTNGEIKSAPNGFYNQKDGSIWIDLNAGNRGEGVMMYTVAHELTHFIKQWSPTKFKALADFIVEQYGKKGVSVDALVREQQKKAKDHGRNISYDVAFEEMVADSMETMLTDGKVIRELAKKDKGLFNKIKSWIDNLLRRLNKEYKNYSPESKEGQLIYEAKEIFTEVQKLFADALVDASDNFAIRGSDVGFIQKNMITETGKLAGIMDSTRTETEAMPKMVMDMSSGNGGKLFTDLATNYLIKGIGDGGAVKGYTVAQIREAIMKANGYNTKQIRNVQDFMKSMADFMDEAGVKYRFIGLKDVEDAKLHYSYNADGSIKSVVLSAMVKNGDYPVNFDFSSICKKRVAMSKLINKLCDIGAMDKGTVNLSPKNIFEINKALKEEGFETACLGCFVESKRYNIQEWANSFIKKWNEAVLKVNPDATYFGFTDGKMNFDNLTSNQVFAIDKAAQTFLNKTGQERRNKAKAVYEEKAKNGEALLEKLPKSAITKIKKSQSLDDSMKDYFLSTDPKAFTLADVELLIDNEILAGKSISNKQKIGKMVESGEQFQHLLRPSDLLTERGITQLEQLPNFHGILYGHYGSGTPKLVQGFTPYNSEIALLSDKKGDKTLAEYLYSIAGVRMQSFSDFQIQNIFDYLQMIADLSARKLPAHAYTKEISFAKLLGMTGIKTNLSVMFDIDTSVDDAHAGLTKYNPSIHQGEYAKIVLEDEQGKWVYNIGDYATQKAYEDYAKMMGKEPVKRFLQSIGFADAVKLQTTEGYTKNCGIIGVGYSDAHILAMLDDSRIRYVIPYHSSSLPHEIKVATNIEKGTDYTSTQNTMKIVGITDKNGKAVDWSVKEAYKRLNSGKAVIEELNKHIKEDGWVVETKKAQNGHGTFDLYGDLSNTSDPRMTADNFMSWCAKNGSLPLFYQFADHNNYYKMLYDFNVYDNVTEEYAPQGAVTNTYPTGADVGADVVSGEFSDAFFKETVEHYMQVQNDFNARLDGTIDELADKIVNNTMPDADFGVMNSLREIVGEDGTNYGVGVYLDSQKLDGLSQQERIEKVREHIEKLGGHPFSAFDNDGNEVKIKVAPKTKYLNEKGKWSRANSHLTNLISMEEKQESLILIDEIISSATFKGKEPANHSHGWLDNNGKNEWDVWTTYIQDKENTIWEAKLKIANTTNGEKILYDVYPIEKVGTGRTMPDKPTEDKIPQDTTESQELFSLRDVNPVTPTSSKWQRTQTTAEVKAQFPDLWDVSADESEVRNPTQISGTVKSYRKVYEFLKKTGFNGTILDASSGLGYGTRAGIAEYGFNVEDIEPYPDASYSPKYTDYSALDKKYDVIISNAVLNVLPQDQRDALVVKMGEMLNDGGRIFVNVRGDDVKNASSKVSINEDLMEYYISKSGSYQKGFTKAELVAYLEDALGDGYTVTPISFFGKVSAVVTKKESNVLYSERDTDSVSTRSLLANALEGAAQNEIEKNKLAQYKEKIALIESEQKKLHELREKLFTKGIKGDERREIQEEATRTANRINTYDRQLFNLEATTALKNVLTREKELARKRQKQKDAENLREYKEKVAKTTRELLKKNEESRKKAVEGRNKTEMRHKVKKVVNDLNNLLLKPTKERHIPEEMRVAVAEALAIVNMDTVDADTRVARYNELIAKEKNPDVIASLTESRDRIINQGNKLAEKLGKLKDAYAMINASADDNLKSMYDDVIYNKIESVQKKVGKTPLRNMTLEQLENVYELYKMVLTTVRDSNKAFAEDLKMTRQALGSNTFAEIKENNKARDKIKHPFIEGQGWKYLKPMMAMKTIGSDILQKLWNNILYGQEVFAQDYDEAVKFAKEMKEKYGYKEWDLHKLYPFESKSGKVMKINLEQMMSIYAYSKRKQADEHIEKGGILLNESIIKEKKLGRTVEVKVNDSTAYRLDKMQVGEIIDTLEKEFPGAKDFVDEMQKYLSETMGEKGNEVSMKMYGIKLFKEEHYFPLKSSKDFMESANAKLKGDVKIKNKGMTKATVEHASNPIVLEGFLDVWGNHINEMAMYHGLVLPLEDFSRTLNYGFKADDKLNADAESVRTALRSAFGESADNYLNELLKAINGGVLHDSSTEFADKMISKFKKSKVMASLSVIVQQPTAIIRAMGIIEPKYFTSQNFHHKQTWEELKKYCPTAIIKETGSFDTNMGRTIVDMVKEDRKFTEKVGDVLGKAPAWMDEMGWNMIWRALKKKVATEQNLSGEALLKECGKQMTLIINETQVYDSVMSRNEFMRSKGALTKMATAFMGEPTTVANMIYGAALDIKRGKVKIASKTVAAVISSVVVNGLVSSLVYALRDDDEEKTWLEKYLASATTEVIDGINPLTYIPYIKDAYSLFQGYDVERTDMALIGDVVDALDDFFNVFDPEAYEDMSRGEIAKHIYESSVPLLTAICDMFGLPVGNILRDAKAIILNDNLPMSKTSSEGSGLAVKEGWLNASPKLVEKFVDDEKYHKLYLIANNGDTAYVKNEVDEMVAEKFDSYKDEEDNVKKAENKAKQSVKSSFTGVYRDEYKNAFKNKDSTEMNEIRKFLYATGLWDSLTELDKLLAKWREDASSK